MARATHDSLWLIYTVEYRTAVKMSAQPKRTPSNRVLNKEGKSQVPYSLIYFIMLKTTG